LAGHYRWQMQFRDERFVRTGSPRVSRITRAVGRLHAHAWHAKNRCGTCTLREKRNRNDRTERCGYGDFRSDLKPADVSRIRPLDE